MGRKPREILCQGHEVEAVPALKFGLAKPMLLCVVPGAQADAPAIRGLETHATVRPGTHMSAFDDIMIAAGHAASMRPHPGAMTRA
jgi:hypothetical protein